MACPVAVALLFLLWTGVIPGDYVSSPTQWTTQVPTCTVIGERLPVVVHVFPLWATVHVRWTASGSVLYSAWGPYQLDVFDQEGTSGNASFVSEALPIAFSLTPLLPPPPGTCVPVNVTTTWSYTI